MVTRRHLSRTTLAFLVALAFWALALAGLVSLAQRPAARRWLAGQVARELSGTLALPVRIADSSFSLYPPRLAVVGIEAGPAEDPMLRIESAEVALSQLRLAERELVLSYLRVMGLRVNGSLPLQARPGGAPWLRILVRQLAVEDVQVERFELPSGVVIAAKEVDLRWSGTPRYPASAVVVHAGAVLVRAPGVEPVEGSLSAWGKRTPEGWEIGRLRVGGRGWKLTARGAIRSGALSGQGEAEVDLAVLDRIAHVRAGLRGEVSLAWQAAVSREEFRVEGRVRGSQVGVVGFPFTDVEGEARVTSDGIEASLAHAGFGGGAIEGSYVMDGLGPPWRHRIAARGQGVGVAAFLKVIGVSDAGLAGVCRVSADLNWSGRRFKEGRGTAVVELREGRGDVPIAGQLVFSHTGEGALGIASTGATLAGAPLRWVGGLSLGTWVPSWQIQADRVAVSVVARLLRGWVGAEVLPPELAGEAALDIRLRGPFSNLSVIGDVAMAPAVFGPIHADGLEASFQVADGKLTLEKGMVLVGAGKVEAAGELRFRQDPGFALELEGKGLPLARLVGWGGVRAPLAGKVDFTGGARGDLAAPTAEARLALREVALAGVPFGSGTGRLALAEGIVRVEDLRVGGFSADLVVDLERREALVDAALIGFGLEGVSPPLARLVGGALDCSLHGAFSFDRPGGRLTLASSEGAHGEVVLDRRSITLGLERPGVWRVSGAIRQAERAFRGRITFGVASWRRITEDLLGAEFPLDGVLDGEAELTVEAGKPPRLEGSVSRLELEIEGERAALESPASFIVEGSALRFPGATLVGPRSSLFVSAERAVDGSLSGRVAGQLPAALLALVWRESNPRGRLDLRGEIRGSD
ncbi:MAG: hypothetical protein V1750_02010, partial [Acidobacteriota bacterium]